MGTDERVWAGGAVCVVALVAVVVTVVALAYVVVPSGKLAAWWSPLFDGWHRGSWMGFFAH